MDGAEGPVAAASQTGQDHERLAQTLLGIGDLDGARRGSEIGAGGQP